MVGPDGLARPLLHYQVRDLLNAGIEQICIIVRPGEDRDIAAYFQGPSPDYLERLKKRPVLLEEAAWMRNALSALSFAYQEIQDGFGHAVYQSHDFAAGDPVLLCLGDHLFRGKSGSPHRRLMDAYDRSDGCSVSAVNRITANQLGGYGTIAGARLPGDPDLIAVSEIVEKPDVATARARLRVDGMEPDVFLGWFGMHALAPSIYAVLEKMIRENIREKGEIQMTGAQELQRAQEGYRALDMSGDARFDFGLPEEYADAVTRFAKKG